MKKENIPARYYSICRKPDEINIFDKPDEGNDLSTCNTCGEKESTETLFPRCSLCFTKYCSVDCQKEDHISGIHKKKCSKFLQIKKIYQELLCKKCWSFKWNSINNRKKGGTSYKLCKNCSIKEVDLYSSLSEDLLDDKDIMRVWL